MNVSSVTAVAPGRGFTPLPVEVWSPSTDFCGAGRGLSIPNAGTASLFLPVGEMATDGNAR